MEIGWDLWGTLPHFLPQQTTNVKPSIEMAKDPHPQPGDFDAELDNAQVDIHEGNPDAKLSILVRVESDDAKRLERIAKRARSAARRGHFRAPAQRPRQMQFGTTSVPRESA